MALSTRCSHPARHSDVTRVRRPAGVGQALFDGGSSDVAPDPDSGDATSPILRHFQELKARRRGRAAPHTPAPRSAYRPPRAGPRRGFPVPHTRAATGEGALYTPGTTVLTPTEATHRPAPAASQRPVPAPRHTIPSTGFSLNEASTEGSHKFARPVFPSPVAARMERAALGLSPGLRTPPTKSRTTHAGVGTGHRARTWNYALNSSRRSPIR